jgi:hypothetical protein
VNAPPEPPRFRPRLLVAALLLALLGTATSPAQVLQLRGGSSSLLDAHGGSLELMTQRYTTRFDLGIIGRPLFGFSLTTRYHGKSWTVGDQTMSLTLPTDLFNRNSYFLGRGISTEIRSPRSSLLLYAGTTSFGSYAPFLSVARSERATGLAFYERQLSSSLRFNSRNIISSQHTSLQSLEWTPRDRLRLAATGGIGNNAGYWSGSMSFERDWISVQGSYSEMGNAFRRVRVRAPLVSEVVGANMRVQFQPFRNLVFTLARQNYLNPEPQSAGSPSAVVESFGAHAVALGFRFEGSVFHSRTEPGATRSLALSVQRSFFGRMGGSTNYYLSRSGGATTKTVSAILRETITRRLELSQVVSRSDRGTTVAFGGSFTSNLFTVSLEHHYIYMPFIDLYPSPFRRVLLVRLQIHLPRNIQISGETNADAAGHVRYTSYLTSYFYPHSSQMAEQTPRNLPKYVVHGTVRDEGGRPIQGAAVQIDGQLVFTNSQGVFLLRLRKARSYPLQVLPDEFMFPGLYEVVSQPATVKAVREEAAEPCRIVLRRVSAVAS